MSLEESVLLLVPGPVGDGHKFNDGEDTHLNCLGAPNPETRKWVRGTALFM